MENKKQNFKTKEIRINGTLYTVKEGDYIEDNGDYYTFISGDGRTLYTENWKNHSEIQINFKKTRMSILNNNMRREEINGGIAKMNGKIRYFFE